MASIREGLWDSSFVKGLEDRSANEGDYPFIGAFGRVNSRPVSKAVCH
jgi:hypothetical protein